MKIDIIINEFERAILLGIPFEVAFSWAEQIAQEMEALETLQAQALALGVDLENSQKYKIEYL